MPKYSKVLAAAAVAATLSLGMTAKAATVTLTLAIGQNNGQTTGVAGQWSLFADDSRGDNFGIVSIQVGLKRVLTIVNDMPRAVYSDSSGTISTITSAGFTALRAQNPANYPASAPLTGSWDTIHGGSDNIWVLQGLGQTAGTLPTAAQVNPGYDTRSPVTQLTYAAHLLIAHGTYDPAVTFFNLPAIDLSVTLTAANVLTALPPFTNPTSATLSTQAAQIVIGQPPEPASLGVLAIGGIALMARRRRIA